LRSTTAAAAVWRTRITKILGNGLLLRTVWIGRWWRWRRRASRLRIWVRLTAFKLRTVGDWRAVCIRLCQRYGQTSGQAQSEESKESSALETHGDLRDLQVLAVFEIEKQMKEFG
jgi:hypothetical protein